LCESIGKKFDDGFFQYFKNQYPKMDVDTISAFVHVMVLSHQMFYYMEHYFHQFGLSHGRFQVLINLRRIPENTGGSAAELTRLCGVKAATMTGLIDVLERDGMVERVRNETDRRKINIRLTPKALAFLDEMLPRHQANIQEIMKDFTSKEKELLVDLKKKLFNGIVEHIKSLDLEQNTLDA